MQYLSIRSLMRSNSTLDDRVSSTSRDRDDSSLKYDNPASAFSCMVARPLSNHLPIWLIDTRSSTVGELRKNDGTASGDTSARRSARPNSSPLVDLSSSLMAAEISIIDAGALAPASRSRSTSLRNLCLWLGSTLGRDLEAASKRLLTCRQLPDAREDAMERKAPFSSPSCGNIFRPLEMHSPARS